MPIKIFHAVKFLSKLYERKLLYWWVPTDGIQNVGDYINRAIVSSVLQIKDKELFDKKDASTRLLAIGSVLHFARTGDCVWGTGVHGGKKLTHYTFTDLDVRAVRGPLTREFLHNLGVYVPEVYGDPAILTPLFFKKDLLVDSYSVKKEFVIVPHLHESKDKYEKYSDVLVSPRSGPASFLRQILCADMVISSSLHGLILAESYGIPSIYLDCNNGEPRTKYEDYYMGTGRNSFYSGNTVEQCLAIGGNKLIAFDNIQKRLLNSFPIDLWV